METSVHVVAGSGLGESGRKPVKWMIPKILSKEIFSL